MRIISPWTKNEQERRIIYDNIINIKRLAELKNLSWLDFWTGNITEDNLKYLISNLPNIKSIMFQTNEVIDFGDISNIPGIETLNIKHIQQNIPMVLSTDTFDNPIKFKGEYAEVSPFATITDSNGDTKEVFGIDNGNISKVKIKNFDKLIKEYAGEFLHLSNTIEINGIAYSTRIDAYILKPEKVTHNITVDGGTSDKTTAKQGEIVNITADKLKDAKKFDKWTSDDITISNPTSTKTSFTMPDKNVSIKANYKDYTPIQELKITTDNILMTTLTTDVQLQVTPANHNDELTWTSSNKNVATVDNKGTVTARAKGQCEITVTTLSNKTAKVKIKVATENIPSSSGSSDDDNQNNNTNNTNKGTSGGGGGGGSSSSKPTQTQTNKTTQEKEQSNQGQQEQKEQTKEIKITDIMTNKQATEKVNNLKDTKEITWSKQAVIKVIQKGIMSGDTNGNFMPKKSVTRAEVAQVIANIIGKKAQTKVEVSDVDNNKWYAKAVQTVLENKIFTQDEKGNLRPESKITRAELFVVIAKLKDIKPLDNTRAKEVLSKYTDLGSIPSWAIGYASALVEKGIVSGEDNKINANDMLTREQLATIFANIVE
ncbi:MAG: S-layer homology domain-containing protein [Peptoanaerobacter stomatis]